MITVPKQALSPAANRRKRPLIMWWPVITTVIACLIFAVGFVIVARHVSVVARAKAHKPKPVLTTTPAVFAERTNTGITVDAVVFATLPPQPRPFDGRPGTLTQIDVPVSEPLDAGDKPTECKACAATRAQNSNPNGGRYGTQVDFIDDPTEAAKLALQQKKLLFVMHIAGNFEDNGFT